MWQPSTLTKMKILGTIFPMPKKHIQLLKKKLTNMFKMVMLMIQIKILYFFQAVVEQQNKNEKISAKYKNGMSTPSTMTKNQPKVFYGS